jgi:F-type H+-transporting ATPase subunit gamma
MTHRHDVEIHRKKLGEIRDIMNSMKTLAYMETRKLSRYQQAQQAVLATVQRASADLLRFYPEIAGDSDEQCHLCVLIGTERGFCGDFNQSLVRELHRLQGQQQERPVQVIAIGRKLYTLLEDDPRLRAKITGASVVEEVGTLISEIVHQIMSAQTESKNTRVTCLFHNGEQHTINRQLIPPFQSLDDFEPEHTHPPLINLPEQQLLSELAQYYLFAALHDMMYTSLMAENTKRVSHLEGAVKHLDEEADKLSKRSNALRQEEIIEEIEVILLNTGGLDESDRSNH